MPEPSLRRDLVWWRGSCLTHYKTNRGTCLATIAHHITAPEAALPHAFYQLCHCPIPLQLVDRKWRDQISAPSFIKAYPP